MDACSRFLESSLLRSVASGSVSSIVLVSSNRRIFKYFKEEVYWSALTVDVMVLNKRHQFGRDANKGHQYWCDAKGPS